MPLNLHFEGGDHVGYPNLLALTGLSLSTKGKIIMAKKRIIRSKKQSVGATVLSVLGAMVMGVLIFGDDD